MARVPVGVPAPTPPPNLLLYISAVTLLYLCNKDFSGFRLVLLCGWWSPCPFTQIRCHCERVTRWEGQQAHSLAGGRGSEGPPCWPGPPHISVHRRSLGSGHCHPELVSGNHGCFPAEQTPCNHPCSSSGSLQIWSWPQPVHVSWGGTGPGSPLGSLSPSSSM